MTVLDTHIWIWVMDPNPRLPARHDAHLRSVARFGLGVSAVSLWEVALLSRANKVQLSLPLDHWLAMALRPPVVLLPITPEVVVDGSALPGTFHRDPSDRIIVATARRHNCPLVTLDGKILAYPHVRLVP